MSRKQKDPKIIHVESPGKGFWEQIDVDGVHKYVFYRPPTEIMKSEALSYDTFHIKPVDEYEEYVTHYRPIKKCPWPLAGEPMEPDPALWDIVKAFIDTHVELPDERQYDLITAFIYASYIPECFYVVPYLHIIGPKGTGKTRLGNLLQQTCYRGFMSSNISEAALFRAVEAFTPTLLLDEAEIYNEKNRSAIQNLLNAGYKRGNPAIRIGGMAEGNPKLELFDVFGFKALIGTGGFKGTLESRAHRITMEKNLSPVAYRIDFEKAKNIRSQLLMWRFRRLADFASVVNVVSVGIPHTQPKGMEYADGRFVELYQPLLFVADDGAKNILSYARDAWKIMIDEEGVSLEAEMVKAVADSAPLVESGWISTRCITEVFNELKPEKEKWKTRSIGRQMKKLGFRAVRRSAGAGWVYDSKKLGRLAKRYGIPLETTTLTTLTTPREEATG